MIDDGKAETLSMTKLSLRFVLCAFHVLKALFKWIENSKNASKHDLSPDKYPHVKRLLYSMLTSQTKDCYLKYYEKLQFEFPKYVKNYFNPTWHEPQHPAEDNKPHYYHWTSIQRHNCINWTKRRGLMKCKRIDVGLNFCITLFEDKSYCDHVEGHTSKKSKTERDIIKRFQVGKSLSEKAYFVDSTNQL